MRDIRAFIQAVEMYLIIGAVIATANALLLPPPHGDTVLDRSLVVLGDVVGWPRFLVIAGDSTLAPLLRHQATR
jgi:hypothetical protein